MKPLATPNVLVHTHDQGTDLTHNGTTHYLTNFAASVWLACDGETSIQEIAEALESPISAVWAALDQLADVRLITERLSPPAASHSAQKITRRNALQHMAAGFAALAGTSLALSSADAKSRRPPKKKIRQEANRKRYRSVRGERSIQEENQKVRREDLLRNRAQYEESCKSLQRETRGFSEEKFECTATEDVAVLRRQERHHKVRQHMQESKRKAR